MSVLQLITNDQRYKVTTGTLMYGTSEYYVERIVIKRVYSSGKIKFKTQEIKV